MAVSDKISFKFIKLKQQKSFMEIHINKTRNHFRRPSDGCAGGVKGQSSR